jgi:hypothetical protein
VSALDLEGRTVTVTMTEGTRAQLRAIARISRALAFEGGALPSAADHLTTMGQVGDLAAALADGPNTLTLHWDRRSE